jgi:hypothetical protein
MAKPTIVTRLGKGSELTFQEGDDNFTNLRDATISITAGTGGTSVSSDLNGELTLVAGTGISLSGNNTAKTITVAATTPTAVTVLSDDTTNATYYPLVSAATFGNAQPRTDSGFTYNPSTGVLTATTFSGAMSYTTLTDKPTIPTNNNELTNGAGYITGINSSAVTTALGFTPESSANKNANNGYAGLDSAGKVASAQLPSYVDDVVEAANYEALPATGETGKIYVTLDINKTFRWSGSAYVEIAASPGTTDNVPEGTTNQYFTTTRARGAFSASTGITITDGAVATTITQYTDTAARGAISVTDAGGDGSASYNSSTGVITYTGPGTTDYRAAFTAGTGITITDGVVASTITDTNTTYGISAETATGGVNLRLTGSDASTDNVKLAQGSNITITRTDADTITIAGSAGGISDVVADTTPQLGGSLDVNGQSIVSVSNGNITLAPNGTGRVSIDGVLWPAADGTNGQVLTTNGSGSASWATASGGGNGIIHLTLPNNMSLGSAGSANLSGSGQLFTLRSSGGISGVSVNAFDLGNFTLPAGTYMIKMPTMSTQGSTKGNIIFRNQTAGSNTTQFNFTTMTIGGVANCGFWAQPAAVFTIAESSRFTFENSTSNAFSIYTDYTNNLFQFEIHKLS